MADSDSSTSLAFVINRRNGKTTLCAGEAPDSASSEVDRGVERLDDPVLDLASRWRTIHSQMLTLCRRQQELEAVLKAEPGGVPGAKVDVGANVQHAYVVAKDEEEHAAQAAGALLDDFLHVPALSVPGVIAKLEVILLEGGVCAAPTNFPWPHIRSALADLKRHAVSSRAKAHSPAEPKALGA